MRHVCIGFLLLQAVASAQTASSVSLIASPNPANYGQPVTLTATVTSGATGKVTFYDGVTILGVGTLSGTQASITTVMLASGNRSLRAYYQGDGTYAGSSSAVAPQTVVTKPSLGLNKAATFSSAFFKSIVSADFDRDNRLDFVELGQETATVYLGNGDGTFRQGIVYSPFQELGLSLLVGDFNGDGVPDLAIGGIFESSNTSSVTILPGNGDGTFGNGIDTPTAREATLLAVADFNNDGKADLIEQGITDNVCVQLGNGDGTFQSATCFQSQFTNGVVVADFNNDNKADLAIGSGNGLLVLLGNGDGTFQSPATILAGGSYYYSVVADINGDGNNDLVTNTDTDIVVLLGTGAGTFQAPRNYPDSNVDTYLLADFNGDGKPDLCLSAFESLQIVPGNGDGTFSAATSYPLPEGLTVAAVGDFNGDSIADILLAGGSTYAVMLGGAVPDLSIAASHGTGLTEGQQGASYTIAVSNVGGYPTFGTTYFSAVLASGLTATAISGSGWNCALATLTCTIATPVPPAAAYNNIAIIVNVAAGLTGQITSNFTVSGGGETNTANDTAVDTAFSRYRTNTSLTAGPNPSQLGAPVTITAAVSAAATGRVDFYANDNFLGSATVANGQAVYATSLLNPGGAWLQAIYQGDSFYGPSQSALLSLSVASLPQNGLLPYTTLNTGVGAFAMATADVNGDGIADVLVMGSGTGTVTALLGNGDGTFRNPIASSFGIGQFAPYGNAIADFNHDGKLDLVSSEGSGNTYLMLGNGDGTFAAGLPAIATSGTSLAAADFNGDGNPDVLILGDVISLCLGNGDGTFQPAVPLTASGVYSSWLAVADMNHDGVPDFISLATTGTFTYTIDVFLGNGDGTFQTPTSTPYSIGGVLAVGDFNGDGNPDLAFVGFNVNVFSGNGDGTFQPVKTTAQAFFTPTATEAIAGDFNGDGKLDLAFPGYASGGVTIDFGNGDGTFQQGPTLSTIQSPGFLVAGDFNRDGIQDLVFAPSYYTNLELFLGGYFNGLGVSSTHSGNFTAGQTGAYRITVFDGAFASSSGDVTVTDTLPSGFTATAMSGAGWSCTVATLTCTRSDGLTSGLTYPAITLTVSISTALQASSVENQVSVTIGGLKTSATDATGVILFTAVSLMMSPNPAGLGQLVTFTATVTSGATGRLLLLDNGIALNTAPIVNGVATWTTRLLPAGLQSLTATYTGDVTHVAAISPAVYGSVQASPATGFSLPATYSTGYQPYSVAVADLNLDGKADLMSANYGSGTVSVWLGNGDGTFGPQATYPAGAAPAWVVAADLNSDGIPDLAIANYAGVGILIGNGNGTFQPVTSISLGASNFLAVSDFNGDGKADLLVNAGQAGSALLLGNGDGTFQNTGNIAGAGVVGDFNRDGNIDIVNSYGIQLGNGNGTFQASTPAGISNAHTVAVGDMNADGNLDIITDLGVSLGNGNGMFQYPISYVAESDLISSLTPTDVNGDGKLDAVSTNYPQGTAVNLGNGDGTLQAPYLVASGAGFENLVAADFNGDGITDLALVDETLNSITILLGGYGPVLTFTDTHNDPFYLGQSGATYTITVSNTGPGTTAGQVNVAVTLTAGVVATAIAGSGWSCTLTSLSCTNTNPLAAGHSYNPITLTVTISATSTGAFLHQVAVTGTGVVPAGGSFLTDVVGTAITLETVPAGLQVQFGTGGWQTAPAVMNIDPGTAFVSTEPTQTGSAGTQYLFSNWSDGQPASHPIAVGATPATYTATFQTQYQLITAVNPPTGGAVTPGAFFNAGASTSITATANPPLIFTGWSNGATTNPLPVTMNAPVSITANFDIPGATCTMTGDATASVADVQYIVNEALGIAPGNNDLNNDGVVNIADVQQVVGAVLHTSCLL